MVVRVVLLEVAGQVDDTLGEDRDLHFRAARVASGASVVRDDFRLLFSSNRHSFYSATSVRLKPLTTRASPPESSISATGTFPSRAQCSPSSWGSQIGRASCRERVCQYV